MKRIFTLTTALILPLSLPYMGQAFAQSIPAQEQAEVQGEVAATKQYMDAQRIHNIDLLSLRVALTIARIRVRQMGTLAEATTVLDKLFTRQNIAGDNLASGAITGGVFSAVIGSMVLSNAETNSVQSLGLLMIVGGAATTSAGSHYGGRMDDSRYEKIQDFRLKKDSEKKLDEVISDFTDLFKLTAAQKGDLKYALKGKLIDQFLASSPAQDNVSFKVDILQVLRDLKFIDPLTSDIMKQIDKRPSSASAEIPRHDPAAMAAEDKKQEMVQEVKDMAKDPEIINGLYKPDFNHQAADRIDRLKAEKVLAEEMVKNNPGDEEAPDLRKLIDRIAVAINYLGKNAP